MALSVVVCCDATIAGNGLTLVGHTARKRVDGGHGDIGTREPFNSPKGGPPWRCRRALTRAARSPRWGRMGQIQQHDLRVAHCEAQDERHRKRVAATCSLAMRSLQVHVARDFAASCYPSLLCRGMLFQQVAWPLSAWSRSLIIVWNPVPVEAGKFWVTLKSSLACARLVQNDALFWRSGTWAWVSMPVCPGKM